MHSCPSSPVICTVLHGKKGDPIFFFFAALNMFLFSTTDWLLVMLLSQPGRALLYMDYRRSIDHVQVRTHLKIKIY